MDNHSYKEAHLRNDLLARGIRDERVIAAFRAVPREAFVREIDIARAYEDYPLPIECGQTISQPYIVTLMTELLELDETDTVLEIGTGSGYQAAILSRICAEVYSVEAVPELYCNAKQRLSSLGYCNITLKLGDGYQGWPEHAPYQGIIVTCAPETIPNALLEQLADGGRMVIPVGSWRSAQNLILVRRRDNQFTYKPIIPVAFVPMVHKKQQPS